MLVKSRYFCTPTLYEPTNLVQMESQSFNTFLFNKQIQSRSIRFVEFESVVRWTGQERECAAIVITSVFVRVEDCKKQHFPIIILFIEASEVCISKNPRPLRR